MIEGRLVYRGDLKLAGKLDGEAELTGGLEVTESGQVNARVRARHALLAPGSRFEGGLQVERLSMADGAFFDGELRMGGPLSEPEPEPHSIEQLKEELLQAAGSGNLDTERLEGLRDRMSEVLGRRRRGRRSQQPQAAEEPAG